MLKYYYTHQQPHHNNQIKSFQTKLIIDIITISNPKNLFHLIITFKKPLKTQRLKSF